MLAKCGLAYSDYGSSNTSGTDLLSPFFLLKKIQAE